MTQSYQSLDRPLPALPARNVPSPLQRAERLEASLRGDGCASVPRIYLKRDDLLSLALGGNKTRNLEFLIGDALARGATDVITAGRQQSNHCRLTAAACAKAGLRAHLVFTGTEPRATQAISCSTACSAARSDSPAATIETHEPTRIREVEAAIERAGGVPYAHPGRRL